MTELHEIWQRAEVSQRLDVLAGFVAVCVAGDEDARRRLALLTAEAEAALAASPPELDVAAQCLDELVHWAEEDWADHPYRPAEARPDEADRQTRDYAKDLRRAVLPVVLHDELACVELSLEVRFLALCRRRHLDPRVREDVFYVAGRAAMALDLGHLEAARREVRRMERVGSVESGPCDCG
ncbi:hypothetical protein [Kitasatospora cheerisanensis]|uniref:Uncharacterized protein n=1 Tax=Kitasatospora cheerisanensis KCTC 2395 TaxID=1348663 RepID=A0A066YHX0_9ACTN|nr:hypothetical protein [Kitasatospora cheerisanensis]KDN81093.1 hypothetical protein KCH_71870 [Kitasatospora cheerisanensis KCTC 2395]